MSHLFLRKLQFIVNAKFLLHAGSKITSTTIASTGMQRETTYSKRFQRKLQHADIVLQINRCFLDSSSRKKLICIEEKALSGIPSIMLTKRCRESRQTDCPAVQAERRGQHNSPSSQGLLHLKLQKKSEEKLEQRELEDVEKKIKSKQIGMRRIKNKVSMRKKG